jgi:hypothetical protein
MDFVETEIELKINSYQYKSYGTFDTVGFEQCDPTNIELYSQNEKNISCILRRF